MFRATFAALLIALAGSASAAGWRALRIDASSEADFVKSVAALRQKLSKVRGFELDLALNDIWVQGQLSSAGRYSASDYFGDVDGLTFKGVLALSDPTGEEAKGRRAAAYARWYASEGAPSIPSGSAFSRPQGPGMGSVTHDINSYNSAMWNTPEQVSAREGR